MMNKFKLGCNFSKDLISVVSELNDKYKQYGVINEFFGSDMANADLAARPDFRLPDISLKFLENFVKKCNDNNIEFNYTMNSILPYGSKQNLLKNRNKVLDFVKYLEDIGVYRITIANPLLGFIIREKSNIPFEISTIMHQDTVTQALLYKKMFGNVDKICASVLKNRDFNFLKNTQKICNDNGITLDLMVNEFCYNTVGGSSSHCIFRDSCYICHAQTHTKEEAMEYNNYPMGYCISSRGNSEAGWLRSRYILPEWLDVYNEIGISAYKLTGRTGSTEYLKKIAEAYLSKNSEGLDLISLWKPLQSIYSGKSEEEESNKYIKIDIKKIVDNNFINHWSDNGGFLCHEHLCGFEKEVDPTYDSSDGVWHGDYACNFCKKFYEKYLK